MSLKRGLWHVYIYIYILPILLLSYISLSLYIYIYTLYTLYIHYAWNKQKKTDNAHQVLRQDHAALHPLHRPDHAVPELQAVAGEARHSLNRGLENRAFRNRGKFAFGLMQTLVLRHR